MNTLQRTILLIFIGCISIVLAACNVNGTVGEREPEATTAAPVSADIEPTPTASPVPIAVPETPTPPSTPIAEPSPQPTPVPEPTATPEVAFGAGAPDEPALFPIRDGNQWGFINRDGEVVIEPQWDRAWEFSDGFARVLNTNDGTALTFGIVDPNGSNAMYEEFTYLDDLSDGLIAFATGGERLAFGYLPFGASWGYMDVKGNIVIEPQFEDAGAFVDGMAAVQIDSAPGYINNSGEFLIEPGVIQDSQYAEQFSDGRALVWSHDFVAGYIDEHGELIIEHQFYRASHFSEGLAAVSFDVGEMGYIDLHGNVVIEPRFLSAGRFSDGLAPASIETDHGPKFGFIDLNGDEVISFEFDYAGEFSNGIAPVGIGEHFHMGIGGDPLDVFDGWGYIDTSGEFVWRQE